MHILFLTRRVPWPLTDGASQRTFALLNALCQKHDVTIVAAAADTAEPCIKACTGRAPRIVRVDNGTLRTHRLPNEGRRLANAVNYIRDYVSSPVPCKFRPIERTSIGVLEQACREVDAIFCKYQFLLPLIPQTEWRRVVLDGDDFEYRLLLQEAIEWPIRGYKMLSALEAIRTWFYEQRIFRRVAHTIACSERDLARIRCKRKSVVRNGVDIPSRNIANSIPDLRTIVMVGSFGYTPNVKGLKWFTQRVWPRVRDMEPEARLNVVGRGATPEALPFALASGIHIVGPVESTSEWFASAVGSVAPILAGSGTRIKIIESLACGRPVISTTLGAEGLERLDESVGVFRADRASAMAKLIVNLLHTPSQSLEVGLRARKVVEAEFSWQVTTATLADHMQAWIGNGDRFTGAASALDERETLLRGSGPTRQ
jgi:glycosyltransferase involved in cell wall biosynthesis